jgi:hypothetical protein
MVPDGLREKFDLYRNWFKTLLIEEYLNLPTHYQARFIIIVQGFLDNCKKIFEEGKSVKERVIEITVQRVVPEFLEEVMKNKGTYEVFGTATDVEGEIKIIFPIKNPRPQKNDKLRHTIFSLDEKIWYSSKKELLRTEESKRGSNAK